jgi:RNA:NAD 2'-phosphotransferase (TPT1/KptA family)
LVGSIIALVYLTPVKIQVPASQEQEEQVAATEGNQNAQISPSGVEADGKRLVELVANAVCAVRTIRSRVVSDVACAAARKEGLHVVAACLARGCGEQV